MALKDLELAYPLLGKSTKRAIPRTWVGKGLSTLEWTLGGPADLVTRKLLLPAAEKMAEEEGDIIKQLRLAKLYGEERPLSAGDILQEMSFLRTEETDPTLLKFGKGLTKFTGSMIADPLSYVGIGLPTRLGKIAAKKAAAEASRRVILPGSKVGRQIAKLGKEVPKSLEGLPLGEQIRGGQRSLLSFDVPFTDINVPLPGVGTGRLAAAASVPFTAINRVGFVNRAGKEFKKIFSTKTGDPRFDELRTRFQELAEYRAGRQIEEGADLTRRIRDLAKDLGIRPKELNRILQGVVNKETAGVVARGISKVVTPVARALGKGAKDTTPLLGVVKPKDIDAPAITHTELVALRRQLESQEGPDNVIFELSNGAATTVRKIKERPDMDAQVYEIVDYPGRTSGKFGKRSRWWGILFTKRVVSEGGEGSVLGFAKGATTGYKHFVEKIPEDEWSAISEMPDAVASKVFKTKEEAEAFIKKHSELEAYTYEVKTKSKGKVYGVQLTKPEDLGPGFAGPSSVDELLSDTGMLPHGGVPYLPKKLKIPEATPAEVEKAYEHVGAYQSEMTAQEFDELMDKTADTDLEVLVAEDDIAEAFEHYRRGLAAAMKDLGTTIKTYVMIKANGKKDYVTVIDRAGVPSPLFEKLSSTKEWRELIALSPDSPRSHGEEWTLRDDIRRALRSIEQIARHPKHYPYKTRSVEDLIAHIEELHRASAETWDVLTKFREVFAAGEEDISPLTGKIRFGQRFFTEAMSKALADWFEHVDPKGLIRFSELAEENPKYYGAVQEALAKLGFTSPDDLVPVFLGKEYPLTAGSKKRRYSYGSLSPWTASIFSSTGNVGIDLEEAARSSMRIYRYYVPRKDIVGHAAYDEYEFFFRTRNITQVFDNGYPIAPVFATSPGEFSWLNPSTPMNILVEVLDWVDSHLSVSSLLGATEGGGPEKRSKFNTALIKLKAWLERMVYGPDEVDPSRRKFLKQSGQAVTGLTLKGTGVGTATTAVGKKAGISLLHPEESYKLGRGLLYSGEEDWASPDAKPLLLAIKKFVSGEKLTSSEAELVTKTIERTRLYFEDLDVEEVSQEVSTSLHKLVDDTIEALKAGDNPLTDPDMAGRWGQALGKELDYIDSDFDDILFENIGIEGGPIDYSPEALEGVVKEAEALSDLRKAGFIGEDWHTWSQNPEYLIQSYLDPVSREKLVSLGKSLKAKLGEDGYRALFQMEGYEQVNRDILAGVPDSQILRDWVSRAHKIITSRVEGIKQGLIKAVAEDNFDDIKRFQRSLSIARADLAKLDELSPKLFELSEDFKALERLEAQEAAEKQVDKAAEVVTKQQKPEMKVEEPKTLENNYVPPRPDPSVDPRVTAMARELDERQARQLLDEETSAYQYIPPIADRGTVPNILTQEARNRIGQWLIESGEVKPGLSSGQMNRIINKHIRETLVGVKPEVIDRWASEGLISAKKAAALRGKHALDHLDELLEEGKITEQQFAEAVNAPDILQINQLARSGGLDHLLGSDVIIENGIRKKVPRSVDEFFHEDPAFATTVRGIRGDKARTYAEFYQELKARGIGVAEADAPPGYMPVSQPELEGFKFEPQVAEALNKMFRFHRSPKEWGSFLRLFDTTQDAWKSWTLAIFPAYHMRNVVGNLWNNWLADIVDPRVYIDAHLALWGKKGKFTDGLGKVWDFQEIKRVAEELGVLNRGWYGAEVEVAIQNQLRSGKWLTLSQRNKLLRKGFAFGRRLENEARLAHFFGKLREGLTPEEAALSVKKFLFDYGDLTDTERLVFKRLFPFYTWTRKNVPLQLMSLIQHPYKFNVPFRVREEVERTSPTPNEKYLPQWMVENFPNRIRYNSKTGEYEYFLLQGWLPSMDLVKILELHEVAATMLTPIPKEILQQAFNYDIYMRRKIEDFGGETTKFLGMKMPKRVVHGLRLVRALSEIDKLTDPEVEMLNKVTNLVTGKTHIYNEREARIRNKFEVDAEIRELTRQFHQESRNRKDPKEMAKIRALIQEASRRY